jgi:hypothetical protein
VPRQRCPSLSSVGKFRNRISTSGCPHTQKTLPFPLHSRLLPHTHRGPKRMRLRQDRVPSAADARVVSPRPLDPRAAKPFPESNHTTANSKSGRRRTGACSRTSREERVIHRDGRRVEHARHRLLTLPLPFFDPFFGGGQRGRRDGVDPVVLKCPSS